MNRLSRELEDALRAGSSIVAANPRAARWLRYEYAQQMRQAGRRAWKTPQIHDWGSWLAALGKDHAPANAPLLLTPLQEEELWLRVQREDEELGVVSPASLAKLAADAYNLLSEYQAHGARNHAWDQPDAAHFRLWASSFDRMCGEHGWLSASKRQAFVAEALLASNAPLPAEILIVGFDRVTPAQQAVFDALTQRGVSITRLAAAAAEATPLLLGANDLREEIALCAEWLRQQLATVALESQPRIAVITPNLESIRPEIERIFRHVLAPETVDITARPRALPYEFSLGQPLASVPIIEAVLLSLRWLTEPLAEEEVSWLLLSGFIAADDAETLAAARLDAELRATASLSMEVSLPSLLSRCSERLLRQIPGVKTLVQRLTELQTAAEANGIFSEARSPSRWTELIPYLLRQIGFPGGRTIDSLRYQALARFDRALEEVALLDFDGRVLSFAAFLRILERHAPATLFALESNNAPIQVMGALEASGQSFDALWFLGLDDTGWPLRGTPHPLLPLPVQMQSGMPHATPAVDLELSRAITCSLASSAPVTVYSYARRNRDGDLRPSPLLAEVSDTLHFLSSEDWLAANGRSVAPPDPPVLDEVPDLTTHLPWPSERSAGGADVLRDQAACPFRAFASRRLAARELNRSEWGLTAAERGNLLHAVLEAIWSPDSGRLHTLEDLLAVERAGHLSTFVEETIAAVFASHPSTAFCYASPESMAYRATDEWTLAYLGSEQRRLARQLTDWLPYEATRAPFEVIATEEKLIDVQVGELRLNLRGDRIDQLPGYRKLLIDYKTGLVSTSDWNPPRPDDPQLPLYAAFGNIEDICGVVFARIRAGESCFLGQVEDAQTLLLPNLTARSALVRNPYTESVREEWTTALLSLADSFLRGEAQVDPKHGAATCQHCPLPTLCRVAEVRGFANIDDNAAEDAEEAQAE